MSRVGVWQQVVLGNSLLIDLVNQACLNGSMAKGGGGWGFSTASGARARASKLSVA